MNPLREDQKRYAKARAMLRRRVQILLQPRVNTVMDGYHADPMMLHYRETPRETGGTVELHYPGLYLGKSLTVVQQALAVIHESARLNGIAMDFEHLHVRTTCMKTGVSAVATSVKVSFTCRTQQ